MAADDQDALHPGAQRQEAAGVLQQHDPLLAGPRGDLRIRGGVEPAGLYGMLKEARGEHAAQQAVGHLVDPRERDFAGLHGVLQGLVEEHLLVELLARFLIEAGDRRLHAVNGAPVRHGPAGIGPVLAQHIGEQERILAGIDAADLVVGAHHRGRMTRLDGDLEGQQIALPEGRLIDLGAQDHPTGLLVVEGEVLGGGGDVVRLDAPDGLSGQGSGQQRVFPQVFEVAAIARVAQQVGAAGQQDVEALLSGLLADQGPRGEGGFRIPGGGERQAGGQGCGVVLLAPGLGHAKARVALGQGRDTQARQTRDVAGGVDDAGGFLGKEGGEVAMQQGDLLVQAHLRDDQFGAPVGVEPGVHPGLARRFGARRLGGRRLGVPRCGERQCRRADAHHQSPSHPAALHIPCCPESYRNPGSTARRP